MAKKSRNPRVGFASTTLRQTLPLEHDHDLNEIDLTKALDSLKKSTRNVDFAACMSRDQVPFLYPKAVNDELNRRLAAGDLKHHEAMMRSMNDDQQMKSGIRNLILKPQYFDVDAGRRRRIYFKNRMGAFKKRVKEFVPEKGQKFSFSEGYKAQFSLMDQEM